MVYSLFASLPCIFITYYFCQWQNLQRNCLHCQVHLKDTEKAQIGILSSSCFFQVFRVSLCHREWSWGKSPSVFLIVPFLFPFPKSVSFYCFGHQPASVNISYKFKPHVDPEFLTHGTWFISPPLLSQPLPCSEMSFCEQSHISLPLGPHCTLKYNSAHQDLLMKFSLSFGLTTFGLHMRKLFRPLTITNGKDIVVGLTYYYGNAKDLVSCAVNCDWSIESWKQMYIFIWETKIKI